MNSEQPVVAELCGPRRGDPKPLRVKIYRFVDPYCDGTGRWPDGSTCLDCNGYGLVNEAPGYTEAELTPAPRPPAVMTRPCADCAYRPGSPEQDTGVLPGPDVPFFCHHGLRRVADGYVSTALLDGRLPFGAMVCAGWWALATGAALPEREFRDPGGIDRHQDAPAIASGGDAA